jgi:hypothetical protein
MVHYMKLVLNLVLTFHIKKNSLALAKNFAFAIETAADHLYDYTVCEHLDLQIKYVNEYYNWKKQANAWTNFLKGALNARSK